MTYMHISYSVSRYITLIVVLLSATCFIVKSEEKASDAPIYVFMPKDEYSKKDNKWTEYIILQSKNRVNDISIINSKKRFTNNEKTIYIHLDNRIKNDYLISVNKNEIILSAPTDRKMLWLIYQWIAKTAETDKRWNAKDLNPAIIDIKNVEGKFDFSYRSIYSSEMSNYDKITLSGDMHVDYDWGIWGHNLKNVFPDKKIPNDAMATINGTKTDKQFCFSSETLRESISEYIYNSFGNGKDGNIGWFAILPNDNMDVCMCEKCKRIGNTDKSATPAVTSLIIKLAEEFPEHYFYTSAYNTTINAPQNKLPQNVGVIISAINLPMNTHSTDSDKYIKWENKLKAWKSITDKIIVWDYMRNFDDYLTPFPCLYSIQNRLKWFKSLGIYGVFYNGSGDDFSTFDDIQTFVISSLLKDINLDIKALTKKYLWNYYKLSKELIFDYYFKTEEKVIENNINLEWYSAIDYSINTYLNVNDFRDFYNKLDLISKQTEDEERNKLNRLLTAMNFTQLEIIRSGYYTNNSSEINKAKDFLELLRGHKSFKNMSKYKEAFGDISEYISSWETINFHKQKKSYQIIVNDNKNCKKLTDGYYGFPNDYHLHWDILDKERNEIIISDNRLDGKLILGFSFLYAPKWNIGLPTKIEIYKNNILKDVWTNVNKKIKDFSIVDVKMTINSENENEPIKVFIYKDRLTKIACDEIEINN